MIAATINTPGHSPAVGERPDPEPAPGTAVVRVLAAPITPLDLLCAGGRSYFGVPETPYVPGVQGVGIADGRAVWFPTPAGMAPGDGSMAELALVPEENLVPLPENADPVAVAALGLSAVAAHMALTWRGGLETGESVLVLGAGGVVGLSAVQLARTLGAKRVVAAARFIPLGGNTVFVRTERLREAQGWDAACLAEDCELGVRLSSDGCVVAVAYDPGLVTREETPATIPELVKQRTRWAQGFLQVLRKGEWRRLPTRGQRLLARYTLAMPFLQAFTGVMIPVSILLMVFAKVPVLVAMVTFLPLVPTLMTLAVEVCGLAEFSSVYRVRARARGYVGLVLGTFPYQVLLAFASLRAVAREARGDNSWEKTAHANLHRQPGVEDELPRDSLQGARP